MIASQNDQISNLTNQVNLEAEMLDVCEKSENKKDRKIKLLKFTRNVVIAILAIETAYIGVKVVLK